MKVLFIDRDGTLIKEPPDGYINSLEKLQIMPTQSLFQLLEFDSRRLTGIGYT